MLADVAVCGNGVAVIIIDGVALLLMMMINYFNINTFSPTQELLEHSNIGKTQLLVLLFVYSIIFFHFFIGKMNDK